MTYEPYDPEIHGTWGEPTEAGIRRALEEGDWGYAVSPTIRLLLRLLDDERTIVSIVRRFVREEFSLVEKRPNGKTRLVLDGSLYDLTDDEKRAFVTLYEDDKPVTDR